MGHQIAFCCSLQRIPPHAKNIILSRSLVVFLYFPLKCLYHFGIEVFVLDEVRSVSKILCGLSQSLVIIVSTFSIAFVFFFTLHSCLCFSFYWLLPSFFFCSFSLLVFWYYTETPYLLLSFTLAGCFIYSDCEIFVFRTLRVRRKGAGVG